MQYSWEIFNYTISLDEVFSTTVDILREKKCCDVC
jgi:hypothetical protein